MAAEDGETGVKGLTERGAKGRATAGRHYGRGASGGDKRDAVARHGARCRICKHAEREEIEREFLDWVSPREIAETWKFASYRAIYRHAHATGLFQRRRENRLAALDRIIERVGEVTVTAAAVVAAIRLSAKLDREGNHRGGGNLGENPPASTAGGAPDFGLRPAADGRGLANGSADGTLRVGPEFVLSLEGLPRTDAVTGRVGNGEEGVETIDPSEGEGRVSPTQTWRSAEPGGRGHRLKPVPREAGDPVGRPYGRVMDEAGGDPPSPKDTADGRVAGMPWPWPKGKIAFARRGRWKRGRGG